MPSTSGKFSFLFFLKDNNKPLYFIALLFQGTIELLLHFQLNYLYVTMSFPFGFLPHTSTEWNRKIAALHITTGLEAEKTFPEVCNGGCVFS